MNTPATEHLERRKRVKVRLRPNLDFTAETGAEPSYVLRDPVSLRYFRLDERQQFLVDHMDGTQSLEEIRRDYEHHYRPERLSLEELETFAAQLLAGGLIQNESPAAGRLLLERAEKQRRAERQSRLLNLFSLKLPLGNPDRLLDRLVPFCGWLFSPACLGATLVLLVGAVLFVATRWHEFASGWPEAREFLTGSNLLSLWVALGLVKVLHELGHGLCAKRSGAQVTEAGVLLLFFFPALYCDVSDAWRVPGRWRRMLIGAAGIYVELLVALAATACWWLSDPTGALHHACMMVMIACSVQTIVFNANPLLRFDGYYILADWLRLPNLAEQAAAAADNLVLRGLGVPMPPSDNETRERWLAAFAVAGGVVRTAALLGGVWVVIEILQPYKLASLGVLAGLLAGVLLLVPLVGRLARTARTSGRFGDMNRRRLGLVLGLAILLACGASVVPLPVTVHGAVLLQAEPEEVHRLVVPAAGGFLRDIVVRDGQHVKAGDILAQLDNPALARALRLNEADQELRQRQKSALFAELADAGAPGGQSAVALQQAEALLAGLVQEHAVLREQADRLVLRAPCDGVVTGMVAVDDHGKWLERGTEICRVANERALRAILLVEAADHELVVPGSPAQIHIRGTGTRRAPGVVSAIALVDAAQIPPQLSARAGGDVATRQDPVSRAETPYQPHYLASVRFERAEASAHAGTLAQVRIDAGGHSLLWRVRRALPW